jgi:hypothetical protein
MIDDRLFFVSQVILFCHFINGVEVYVARNVLGVRHNWPVASGLHGQYRKTRKYTHSSGGIQTRGSSVE